MILETTRNLNQQIWSLSEFSRDFTIFIKREKGRKDVNLIKRTGRSPAKQRLLGSAQWFSCAREEVTLKAHYGNAPPSGARAGEADPAEAVST